MGELVQFQLRTSSQTGGFFGVTGSVGGLGSTQIEAEPGESQGGGAISLPTVKYPAGVVCVCVCVCVCLVCLVCLVCVVTYGC